MRCALLNQRGSHRNEYLRCYLPHSFQRRSLHHQRRLKGKFPAYSNQHPATNLLPDEHDHNLDLPAVDLCIVLCPHCHHLPRAAYLLVSCIRFSHLLGWSTRKTHNSICEIPQNQWNVCNFVILTLPDVRQAILPRLVALCKLSEGLTLNGRLWCSFSVYGTSSKIGSPAVMWERMSAISAVEPVSGNRGGSYLTMWSLSGVKFGILQVPHPCCFPYFAPFHLCMSGNQRLP